MSTGKALKTVDQRTVVFYEDKLTAVRVEDGTVYVPLKPICELLGISWASQYKRLGRDGVLSKKIKPCVVVTTTQGQPDQRREVIALPIDYVSGFLFGINAARVKEDVRDRLMLYQERCYQVLAEAFKSGELTAEDDIETLAAIDPEAAEAVVMAQAVLKIARAHLRLAKTVKDNRGDIDESIQRIEALEATVNDDERHVTDEQASQISQAVKGIALALSKASGKNEFGGVYGELYRRQGVTSYKMIKAADFETCIAWLNEWYQSAVGDDLHF